MSISDQNDARDTPMTDYDALEKRLEGRLGCECEPDEGSTAGLVFQCQACKDMDAIHDLRVERDALRKDAERYRWLRVAQLGMDVMFEAENKDGHPIGVAYRLEGEQLDAAIDAALAAQEKP